jgi:hypothetical protein
MGHILQSPLIAACSTLFTLSLLLSSGINCIFIMVAARRSILILLILMAIHTHQRVVVVEALSVVSGEQITISTRFKSSDILLSNRSRHLAASNQNYSDMGQVPTVKVDYQTTNARKWRQITPETSAYLIKTAVDDADLLNYL